MINPGSIRATQKTVTTADVPTKLSGHMVASTISFTAASRKISDSASKLLNAGFRAGDTITVSGSTSNDGIYKILTVAAAEIVLVTGSVLTNELASATITLNETGEFEPIGYPIPDGSKVTVQAKKANTGTIYIANSSDNALTTSTNNFSLTANESVEIQVSNLSAIWINASVSGEGVQIIYEN